MGFYTILAMQFLNNRHLKENDLPKSECQELFSVIKSRIQEVYSEQVKQFKTI